MIGPVQLLMIGYNQPRIGTPLRAAVNELKANPAIRIIDVLYMSKSRAGTIERETIEGLTPEHPHEPGTVIDTLLTKGEAARTMGEVPSTGPGYLFRGDVLPDPRTSIPAGSGVLAILLEHLWAIALRNTAAQTGAFPVADGWMGEKALKDVDLIPQDA